MMNEKYTWVEGAFTAICMQNAAVDLLEVLFVLSNFVIFL